MRKLVLILVIGLSLGIAHIYGQLIAVHATDYAPVGGFVRAGQGGMEFFEGVVDSEILDLVNQSRATVHFSLGELVRPVGDWKSWEDCKFAVVVPLKDLMPQVINLNCYDTFILGDFLLTPDSVLVAPVGERIEGAYEYDPSLKSLREAVDDVIQQMNGWSIRMLDDEDEDVLREAMHEGENINTKAFFAPLLAGRPYISVGLRFDEQDGEHYRLFANEMETIGVIDYFFEFFGENDVIWPVELLEEKADFLRENFKDWSLSLVDFEMNQEGVAAFQRLSKNLDILTNIIELEIYLNHEYGRSLKKINPSVRKELIARWNNLDDLKNFCIENWTGLEKGGGSPPRMIKRLF